MPQGREALYALLEGKASWPPVVVPFGLDPFGWHGERESYRDICSFALAHCTLLPKVYPFADPLAIGAGAVKVDHELHVQADGTWVRRFALSGAGYPLWMEEVRTPDDASWKTRKRWIEGDDDLDAFLALSGLAAPQPDIQAVREKEAQVGAHGLPYAEVADPFYTVTEMFPTDLFFIKLLTDTERISGLLAQTAQRILDGLEALCRDASCPFVLRLIGAEMAVPPFLSRADFLRFEGDFYARAARIARRYGVPVSFHCHGPVRDILGDILSMGYNFVEPFEPAPRGNVSIAEALALAGGRAVVFGGLDDVLVATGSLDEVRGAVQRCLDDARATGGPYILSQSATTVYDPLPTPVRDNLLLFLQLGTGA